MILYYALMIYFEIILIISQYEKVANKFFFKSISINNILFIFTILICWFITAFRGTDIGNDTISYIEIFDFNKNASNIFVTQHVEAGWRILCFLISIFTNNPIIFIIIIATIIYSLTAVYILKYSKNPLLSVIFIFAFYFTTFLSSLRQSVAILIVAFGYQQLKQHHKLKFLILIILASFFHKSSLIACLLLLYNIYPKKIKLILIICFITTILSLSGLLTSLLPYVVPNKYQYYLNNMYTGTGRLAVTAVILKILLIIFTASMNKNENSKLFIANLFLLLFIDSFGYINNHFTRLGDYFMFIASMEYSSLVINSKIKNIKLWNIFLGTGFLFYFIITLIFRPEWNHLYPYHFFWN